jgi:hypothetical protein
LQSKAIAGLYKAKASITMKSSKLLKVVLAGACTLGLATVSLAVPASAQSGGGGTGGSAGSGAGGKTSAPTETNSGVLSAQRDRPNNLGWLGALGALGLLNLFRKGNTASDRR